MERSGKYILYILLGACASRISLLQQFMMLYYCMEMSLVNSPLAVAARGGFTSVISGIRESLPAAPSVLRRSPSYSDLAHVDHVWNGMVL